MHALNEKIYNREIKLNMLPLINALPEVRSSRPSTGSSSIKLPPASIASEHECDSQQNDTENVLQAHYLRVQQTLLSAVDRQVQGIQGKVQEKEFLLRKTREEKESMGVALYGTKQQVGRLNNTLARVTDNLEMTRRSEMYINMEADALIKEVNAFKKETKELKAVQNENKEKMWDNDIKIKQLTEINSAFNSDLKIQTKIQSKLRKDLEHSENARKDYQARDDTEKRRVESVRKITNVFLALG
jgi:chromosome segregation ATPase